VKNKGSRRTVKTLSLNIRIRGLGGGRECPISHHSRLGKDIRGKGKRTKKGGGASKVKRDRRQNINCGGGESGLRGRRIG